MFTIAQLRVVEFVGKPGAQFSYVIGDPSSHRNFPPVGEERNYKTDAVASSHCYSYRLSVYRGYIWYDSADNTAITMIKLRSDLHSRMTPHTSPLRARYGVSFVCYTRKNDRDISRAHCIIHVSPKLSLHVLWTLTDRPQLFKPPLMLTVRQIHPTNPTRHHFNNPQCTTS